MENLKQVINENNYKDALRLANRLRYENDPEMKKRINEKKREYDRRKRSDPEYRKIMNERQKQYYKNNEEYKEKQRIQSKARYEKKKEKLAEERKQSE